jgi:hypothetical protein
MAENWADTTRTVEFEKDVSFQLNQMPGKLSVLAANRKSGTVGKLVEITDRFTDLYAEDINEHNGTTNNTDWDVERRWIVKPKRASVAPLLDPDDEMTTEVGLKSPLVMGVTKAIGRYRDDKFLEGFYGNAYSGESGQTAIPFKAANVIASGGVGLTLTKLLAMQELFLTRDCDIEMEMPIAVITAKQANNLLSINEIRSKDYNPLDKQALQSGRITEFLGFRFIMAQIGSAKAYRRTSTGGPGGTNLTLNGADRRVPFFLPSGMAMREWLSFSGKIDELPTKSHSTQIAGYSCAAFTRVDEDKCFIMDCFE